MGIAEKSPVANAAFTNMACVVVLRGALAASELDRPIDPKWREIADGMLLPRREKLSHDGYRRDEEKGATPDPLGDLAVRLPGSGG